ncbi:hypothetical protein OVY01_04055 [Robbsia sp. Bb-Pol-6]|uniref:Uncharacterized protein n=1 Tax=Robbsia betulipollinis TaxID=2981849 RepID=A0ABT3ZIS1_9BURK|nr:hypothetical protein [Robbsia betulipollinis]MCY0386426.1 hypothetical protein [Robbsia betulipollinis]
MRIILIINILSRSAFTSRIARHAPPSRVPMLQPGAGARHPANYTETSWQSLSALSPAMLEIIFKYLFLIVINQLV